MNAILEIEHLTTRFATPDGEVHAVSDVDLRLDAGETVGIVGESGSGKSQLFLTVMGLLAGNGRAEGSARYRGTELLGLSRGEMRRYRGRHMAMIFQDPMTSLNPHLTVGRQLTEVLNLHKGMDAAAARAAAIAMLEQVRIPDGARRMAAYPHEFSGGMRQRIMIAMALLGGPDLLIADEPTTALDVTVQAQILELLRELKASLNGAIVLITHDLGVIAGLCDRVAVMYAGRLVEEGPVEAIFAAPKHPYTQGLLAALPRVDAKQPGDLFAIPGQPPNLQRGIVGCAFAPRCHQVIDRCRAVRPLLADLGCGRRVACHRVGA
ncbi:MAG: ABC transporter ATP-binding protein [Alphaproteobacteria bacterium]|nr:ABC transporter ATP-binding protein [Alphaproteobacteria bacterium]